ncbi:MAG: hypothetical protein KIT87_01190 [Anaerolineae bacterium]|nr:hypothetical protein [Anaerolineae bacterium]
MRLVLVWLGVGLILGLVGLLAPVEPVTTAAPLAQATAYPGPGVTPTTVTSTPFPASNFLYLPLANKAPQGAPAAPALQAAPIREGGYRLWWDATPGVDLYMLYQAATANMDLADLVDTVRTGEPTVLDFAPPSAGVLYYRLVAVNRWGITPGPILTVSIPAAPTLSIEEVAGGGYGVIWNAATRPVEYRLFESTSPSMTPASEITANQPAGTTRYFPPRPKGTYYYVLVTVFDQVAVVSRVLEVAIPRPGLWGTVKYNDQPIEGILVELRRCTLAGPRCTPWTTLETVTTQRDGTYSFTRLDPSAANTAYYVYFDNPARRTNYLNFWRGRNIVGYNGRDTVEASRFDIANIYLEEPANNAFLPNPVGFRWQRRPVTSDTYCVMFLDRSLAPLIPCYRLGYIDTTRLDVAGLLSFNTAYNWTTWVDVESQGYGEAFYYRTLTILPMRTAQKEGLPLRLLLDQAASPPWRESNPPVAEP